MIAGEIAATVYLQDELPEGEGRRSRSQCALNRGVKGRDLGICTIIADSDPSHNLGIFGIIDVILGIEGQIAHVRRAGHHAFHLRNGHRRSAPSAWALDPPQAKCVVILA
jgi:hypothetical protein